jgi:predicted DNA-binding protein
MATRKSTTINIRLSPELKARAEKAAKVMGGYSIPITAIVERGIVLACEEIEKQKEGKT